MRRETVTRQEALKRLRKMYGDRAYARVHTEISSPEKREEKSTRLRNARHAKEAIDREISEFLATCEPYQALQVKRRAIVADLRGMDVAPYYKFTIGINRGWCTEVTGQGDTWEEAIAMAEAKGRTV